MQVLSNEARIEAASLILGISADALRLCIELGADDAQRAVLSCQRTAEAQEAKGERSSLARLSVGIWEDRAAHLSKLARKPVHMFAGDINGVGDAWSREA